MRDPQASLTRPVLELKSFVRLTLEPGASRITFDVPVGQLGFYDRDLEYVVEPGVIEVFVGTASDALVAAGGGDGRAMRARRRRREGVRRDGPRHLSRGVTRRAPCAPGPPRSVDAERRVQLIRAFRASDVTFRLVAQAMQSVVLLILGGVIVALGEGAWPALKEFGFGFLINQVWNPVTQKFGAAPAIYGTVITSFIAMLIAVPVGIGIAIFLTELCPAVLRRPIGIAIELLAGIPSIIYGIWGLFIFAPFMQTYVQPTLISVFGNLPIFSTLFGGPPYGIGILTAGLILAIMVLPFITSISRDVFETVPPVLKEAAYGIGCTTWEVVKDVVIPYTRVGVIGGIMLGATGSAKEASKSEMFSGIA